MQIILFIWHLRIGGAQTQIAQLADRLAQQGHEVLVVTAYPGGENWVWLQDRARVQLRTLFTKRLEGAARVWAGPRLVWGILRLRRLLPKHRATFVYSTLDVNNLMAWLATRRRPRAKLVWRMAGSERRLTWAQALVFRVCQRTSGAVPLLIANSRAGLAYYDAEGFRCRRRLVIPNGVDTEHFRADPRGRQRG